MKIDCSRKIVDYNKKLLEYREFLKNDEHAVMVLATSCADHVLARNILTINDGINIYFFTWKFSRKCKDIEKNRKVALCRDNVQIEGEAEIVGTFTDKNVKIYLDIFRNRFPGPICKWEQRPSMVIIKVNPTLVTIGGSIDPPSLEFLDIKKEIAYSEPWAHY
jgi:general stress protein 26